VRTHNYTSRPSPDTTDSAAAFRRYASTPLRGDLLPIMPPDARISAENRNREALLAKRGKIPGVYTNGFWRGMPDWTSVKARPQDIATWSRWNCGIGVQGRNFPGLDIDITAPEIADAIEALAVDMLGAAPARFGRGARRLLAYRGQSHRKRRMAFTVPGHDEQFAIELLGEGQHWVAEGIHPKTGFPYQWRDNVSAADLAADGLALVSTKSLDEFFHRAAVLIDTRFGGQITESAREKTGKRREKRKPDEAPSIGAVRDAVAVIPVGELSYDEWIEFGCAIAGSTGHSAEGFDIFYEASLDYPDNTDHTITAKWASFAESGSGWYQLSQMARSYGFNAAAYEFEPLTDQELAELNDLGGNNPFGPDNPSAFDRMFQSSVWVENLQQAFCLDDLALLNREQFNARFWDVGPPHSSTRCAWAQFLADGVRRQTVKSVTYRPGGELLLDDPVIGGLCINVWRGRYEDLPSCPTDAEIRPWLNHVAYLVPNEAEREAFINWMAWVAQNPDKKPNWGVLIGSDAHGVGKSLLPEPLRAALGPHNCREIGPSEIAGSFNGWLAETKLLIVEEMHSFDRKEVMNKLKSMLATPPWTLQVNRKFGRQYEIPNLNAALFFTNHRDALALEKQDRRFMVIWSDAQPKPQDYYSDLISFYQGGGAQLAAAWLLARDLTGFSALGHAPHTDAKADMQASTRPALDAWLEDGIEFGEGLAGNAFGPSLVALDDLRHAIPEDVRFHGQLPPASRFSAALRRLGAKGLIRISLGQTPSDVIPPRGDLAQARLYSLRNHDKYASMSPDELVSTYWSERAVVFPQTDFFAG
jgi:Family of unknown function (DUF5906)/Primase C terminal 2 (PriCT-2)